MFGLSVLIKHYCITAACELYFSINGEETKISSGFYGNKASWKVHVGGGGMKVQAKSSELRIMFYLDSQFESKCSHKTTTDGLYFALNYYIVITIN